MEGYVDVLGVDDLPAGSMKSVMTGGKKIALANVDGEFFAVDDTCTHEACSLGSEGYLDGNVIVCGCHGAQFDVTDGLVLALPATTSLNSYLVKVSGGRIYIGV